MLVSVIFSPCDSLIKITCTCETYCNCKVCTDTLNVQLMTRKGLYLVSLEIRPAAGGEALLAAEALQLTSHAQRIAFDADLLAPGAQDLHIGCIFVWERTKT